MRHDQLMGLPPDANLLLSNCKKESSGRTFTGMFDVEYPLYRYYKGLRLKYIEEVQAEPWSSGPCIFLQLRDLETNKIVAKWSQHDIDSC